MGDVMNRSIQAIVAVMLLGSAACSTTSTGGRTMTSVIREPVSELERDPVPGTVNDVWVEPMYETVRVPGQLDPRGVYYRKSHTAVVEVRPGRFQLGEYPEDRSTPDETPLLGK